MIITITFVIVMAKQNNYLKEKPTESFRIRFSDPYAKKLVKCLLEKAKQENRSFPSAIEMSLVEYFKLNTNTKKP